MTVRPLTLLIGAATLAYPLLVHAGISNLAPKWFALLLGAIALARAAVSRGAFWWVAAAGALGLAAAGFAGNAWLPLKLYPVLVNVMLLVAFAFSLWHPPSAIERLARLREPDLPPHAVAYTRRVTQVWCGFFVVNGAISAATVVWGSDATWALYNGLLSYGFMGLLFAAEFAVRRRVRAAHERSQEVAAHG